MRINYSEILEFNHEALVMIDILKTRVPNGFQIEFTVGQVGNGVILDTFDSTLRRSNRLLIDQQEKLILFDGNSGRIATQPCASNWRFINELSDHSVKSHLNDVSSLRAFTPIAEFSLQSGQLLLLDKERKTHARVYFYDFDQDTNKQCLAILQPLRGYARGHRILLDALTDEGATIQKKISISYSRFGINNNHYSSKPKIAIEAKQPVKESATAIIKAFIQVARQNEEGIIADIDTEFLHDYRISLRRIRSVLSLFKGVYAKDDTFKLINTFATIMKKTNLLRDLDVFLLHRDLYLSMIPQSMSEGLNRMLELVVEDRVIEHQNVSHFLQSDDYKRSIQQLEDQFKQSSLLKNGPTANEPAFLLSCKLIYTRYKKVCKIARGITADTPDEIVHRLRIQCKKLRYLMEFFSPLFPASRLKKLIKSLKKLQDNLGRFNDFSVQQTSIHSYLVEHVNTGNCDLQLSESVGGLITVLHQRQLYERNRIMENFSSFDSPKGRMTFKTLFKTACAK